MPLVEHDLVTLPEHMTSPRLWDTWCSVFVFFCVVFFVLLSFCCGLVCCMSFDLRLLIITLVSSIFQEGHKESQSARVRAYCLKPNDHWFHLYHGGTRKLHFNETIMISSFIVLDQHDNSLKQQYAGEHIAPHGHIILIPTQRVIDLTLYCSEIS